LARAKAAENSSRAAKAGSASSPVVKQIVSSARDVPGRITARRESSQKRPLRSLSNARRNARKGHLEMAGRKKERQERFLP
jgi:hypothetical protein